MQQDFEDEGNAETRNVTGLEEMIEDLPDICGSEGSIRSATAKRKPVFLPGGSIDSGRIQSAFSIALHMQQPLIPAGGDDIGSAEIISNLKYMMDHQDIGDNHNAPVFYWCYKRMGEFIPQLVHEGKQPRIMLDYSGCLLHGLRKMGADDLFDALKRITCQPDYQHCVEWLGSSWGHAVAPSTPVQDYRLHVKAWQHHFAAIFGMEALERVRGFSPAEMAVPNHPNVAYEFVKTLKDCGYQWLLIQEHSVELPDGNGLERKHIPHRLLCRNSLGEVISILALIKTQGSDTKLVAQMQPYYEARELGRLELDGHRVPPLVTQIGDGENGGVMMNEFPEKYIEVMREASGSPTPAMNGTEYLEQLMTTGLHEEDLPICIPLHQKKIWDAFPEGTAPEKMEAVIEELRREDPNFHVEGGSWTNNISWVKGYDNVLGPMEEVSALFNEKVLSGSVATTELRYRKALFHLLTSQTSCYRYWSQGIWTDYGREICRRAKDILGYDFD